MSRSQFEKQRREAISSNVRQLVVNVLQSSSSFGSGVKLDTQQNIEEAVSWTNGFFDESPYLTTNEHEVLKDLDGVLKKFRLHSQTEKAEFLEESLVRFSFVYDEQIRNNDNRSSVAKSSKNKNSYIGAISQDLWNSDNAKLDIVNKGTSNLDENKLKTKAPIHPPQSLCSSHAFFQFLLLLSSEPLAVPTRLVTALQSMRKRKERAAWVELQKKQPILDLKDFSLEPSLDFFEWNRDCTGRNHALPFDAESTRYDPTTDNSDAGDNNIDFCQDAHNNLDKSYVGNDSLLDGFSSDGEEGEIVRKLRSGEQPVAFGSNGNINHRQGNRALSRIHVDGDDFGDCIGVFQDALLRADEEDDQCDFENNNHIISGKEERDFVNNCANNSNLACELANLKQLVTQENRNVLSSSATFLRRSLKNNILNSTVESRNLKLVGDVLCMLRGLPTELFRDAQGRAVFEVDIYGSGSNIDSFWGIWAARRTAATYGNNNITNGNRNDGAAVQPTQDDAFLKCLNDVAHWGTKLHQLRLLVKCLECVTEGNNSTILCNNSSGRMINQEVRRLWDQEALHIEEIAHVMIATERAAQYDNYGGNNIRLLTYDDESELQGSKNNTISTRQHDHHTDGNRFDATTAVLPEDNTSGTFGKCWAALGREIDELMKGWDAFVLQVESEVLDLGPSNGHSSNFNNKVKTTTRKNNAGLLQVIERLRKRVKLFVKLHYFLDFALQEANTVDISTERSGEIRSLLLDALQAASLVDDNFTHLWKKCMVPVVESLRFWNLFGEVDDAEFRAGCDVDTNHPSNRFGTKNNNIVTNINEKNNNIVTNINEKNNNTHNEAGGHGGSNFLIGANNNTSQLLENFQPLPSRAANGGEVANLRLWVHRKNPLTCPEVVENFCRSREEKKYDVKKMLMIEEDGIDNSACLKSSTSNSGSSIYKRDYFKLSLPRLKESSSATVNNNRNNSATPMQNDAIADKKTTTITTSCSSSTNAANSLNHIVYENITRAMCDFAIRSGKALLKCLMDPVDGPLRIALTGIRLIAFCHCPEVAEKLIDSVLTREFRDINEVVFKFDSVSREGVINSTNFSNTKPSIFLLTTTILQKVLRSVVDDCLSKGSLSSKALKECEKNLIVEKRSAAFNDSNNKPSVSVPISNSLFGYDLRWKNQSVPSFFTNRHMKIYSHIWEFLLNIKLTKKVLMEHNKGLKMMQLQLEIQQNSDLNFFNCSSIVSNMSYDQFLLKAELLKSELLHFVLNLESYISMRVAELVEEFEYRIKSKHLVEAVSNNISRTTGIVISDKKDARNNILGKATVGMRNNTKKKTNYGDSQINGKQIFHVLQKHHDDFLKDVECAGLLQKSNSNLMLDLQHLLCKCRKFPSLMQEIDLALRGNNMATMDLNLANLADKLERYQKEFQTALTFVLKVLRYSVAKKASSKNAEHILNLFERLNGNEFYIKTS